MKFRYEHNVPKQNERNLQWILTPYESKYGVRTSFQTGDLSTDSVFVGAAQQAVAQNASQDTYDQLDNLLANNGVTSEL